jgi:hypothetical protein
MDRDLYDVLGVPRTASEEEIRHAYWSLAKKYHPDVSHDDPDAGRKFIEAQKAAETLLDPTLRASYDASLRAVTPAAARSTTTGSAPAPAQPAPPASPQATAPPTSPPPASSPLAEVIRNLVVALAGVGAIFGIAFGLGHPKNSSGVIPDNGTVVWKAADFTLDDGWGLNLAGDGARVQIAPGTTADITVADGYLWAGGHIASLPPGDVATYQHCVSAVEQSSDQSIPLVEIGPIIHGPLCLSGSGGELASIQVTRDDGADLTFNITVWVYV